jgi:thymidylate kinase
MKIILEGCDGTGKTTLGKKLAEKYGLDYVHINRDDPTSFDFYYETMRKTNVIWDRHFIGEMIYPGIFNREPSLRMSQFEELLLQSKKRNVIVLILVAETSVLQKNNQRDEYEEVVNNLRLINGQFIALGEIYKIPIINVFKMSFDEIVKVIENYEKGR